MGKRFEIEVLTQRTGTVAEIRLYTLIKQGGRWLIDTVQTSHGGAFRRGIL